MEKQSNFSQKTQDVFLGRHTDIVLPTDDIINERLTSHQESIQTYLHCVDQDQLPYPTQEVSLESWRPHGDADHKFSGILSFSPLSFENNPGAPWPQACMDHVHQVLTQYDYTGLYALLHDRQSIYIPLDAAYVARIHFTSGPDECQIAITTENAMEIEDKLNVPKGALINGTRPVQADAVDKLHHIATILGISIEAVRELYGAPPKHHKKFTIMPVAATPSVTQESEPQIAVEYQPILDEDELQRGLDHVGGAFHAKHVLHEIASVFQHKEQAKQLGIYPEHILLHGPSGTGKTSLARAFAHEIKATLIEVSSTDIVSKWVGDSGKNLAEKFTDATRTPGNVVLFFDEFDTIAKADMRGTSERDDIKRLLNIHLDELTHKHPNIIVIGTTNLDIDAIEPSLTRSGRMRTINVPAPTKDERLDIWGCLFTESQALLDDTAYTFPFSENSNTPIYTEGIKLEALADATHDMTGADIATILNLARRKKFFEWTQTGTRSSITHDDLLQAITTYRR